MTDTLFVGIDISQKNNVVCLLDPLGKKVSKFSCPNNTSGSSDLVERVVQTLNHLKLSCVAFGLEATSIYADGLMFFLSRHSALARFSRRIVQLNPRQVKHFKDAYNDLPKTDATDAFVIADFLRFGRNSQNPVSRDERYQALQNLTRMRFHVAQDLAAEKNRYLVNLFRKFSVMAQEDIFSDNFGVTAMAVVEQFETVDQIAYMPLDELAAFINKTGRGKFVDPQEIAAHLQRAARDSYRLPKLIEESVNEALAVSQMMIRTYQDQLKRLDKSIAKLMEAIPNTLTSIPGIGQVYSAGIIAEVGDPARFRDQAALAKYAGLTWSKHQSGSFESDHTHLIRSGNRYLRYYFVEAANLVRMHDHEMKRFYELKYNETPKTPHKRALALTARKLVRLVFALLRDNKLYTPPSR